MNSLYKTKKKKLLYLEDFSKAENIFPETLMLLTERSAESGKIICKFYYKNRHYIFAYIRQKDFDEIFECISYV